MAKESEERARVQREQVESMRVLFAAVRDATRDDDGNPDGEGKLLGVLAEIMELWQRRACGGNPVDCSRAFGGGATITLRDVLSLVPEQYQENIVLEGYGQGLRSWLDEGIMNVLLQLVPLGEDSKIHFARGLAADCSRNLDTLTKDTHPSRLEFLADEMKAEKPDWNSNGFYTIPATTERVVFLWNYHENHWSVVGIKISDDTWTYMLLNSLGDNGVEDYTWRSFEDHVEDLQPLICAASGITPPQRSKLRLGASAKQANSYGCGVFAVVNAATLLTDGAVPELIDPLSYRLIFLETILKALKRGDGINAVTPRDRYSWEVLRLILRGGNSFDRMLVTLFDRALGGVLTPSHDTDTKLKEGLLGCLDKALGLENMNEELLQQEVRLLPYKLREKTPNVQTSSAKDSRLGEAVEKGQIVEQGEPVEQGGIVEQEEVVERGGVAEGGRFGAITKSDIDTKAYGVSGVYGDIGFLDKAYE